MQAIKKCPYQGHSGNWYLETLHESGISYDCGSSCVPHFSTRREAAEAAREREDFNAHNQEVYGSGAWLE